MALSSTRTGGVDRDWPRALIRSLPTPSWALSESQTWIDRRQVVKNRKVLRIAGDDFADAMVEEEGGEEGIGKALTAEAVSLQQVESEEESWLDP